MKNPVNFAGISEFQDAFRILIQEYNLFMRKNNYVLQLINDSKLSVTKISWCSVRLIGLVKEGFYFLKEKKLGEKPFHPL